MKLSDLKTGEHGVIVKVLGHGGFRKRIIEMGFIRGKEVEVLLNAPLQDPVKYKLMGYEVSLRRQEAEMIEVLAADEMTTQELSSHLSEFHFPVSPEGGVDDCDCSLFLGLRIYDAIAHSPDLSLPCIISHV
jgi:Fe2+ transport system protein FeoA